MTACPEASRRVCPRKAIWRTIVGQMATTPAPRVARRSGSAQGRKRRTPGRGRPGLARFRQLLRSGTIGPTSYAELIGLETADARELVRVVEHGLPYSVFEQLVANTSMPTDVVLALAGIPLRTLTRRKRDGRFRQDESDRLVRAARVFGRALSLFEGDRDAARDWFSRPQKALGGASPVVLARTEVGAIEVERLIGRLEHGVFT